MTNSDNIELAFKHHFPNLSYEILNNNVYCSINTFLNLSIRKRSYEDGWESRLRFGYQDFIPLHQSTDLNELMQVTKQKLKDMFADWIGKIN